MAMSKQLILDTDILSNLMKKNENVIIKAQSYLSEHRLFTFSVITKYEILRGLKSKKAEKQIERFLFFCDNCLILSVDNNIVDKASSVYAELQKQGKIIGDADILIGATALVNGFGIVTNNYEHYRNINGLQIENWMK
jgi:tRNA(fMet)-specific endonuclease VapC